MKKKYKIREKSLAWYCVNYWQPLLIIAVIVALWGACLIADSQERANKGNIQESTENRSEVKIEFKETFWDVPLEKGVQIYVQAVAEDYGIRPELILAVIGTESNYQADAVGDNGNSVGLMQVQEQYHSERMARLNATNLYSPYHNILVGTDYLAECINKGGSEWGLMAYNGGAAYADAMVQRGEVSEYAETVLKLAELLEGARNDRAN